MDGKMRIMTCQEIKRVLTRLSQKFLEKHQEFDNLGIIGIQRRGANLAFRISEIIGRERGKNIPVGTVDITFYRDDLSRISYHPTIRNTDIAFPLDDRDILL
ncbi:bifunctional pyr operon transcriptional regulator/uracil phosphoribosyltransferase, partial [Candidatus Aerophobetes bacterium]|nr:bifunctional pyr operon transcriptional regulator/uracil phosphoribosyltransferase [Candidatus Aerophobetes bacterium]